MAKLAGLLATSDPDLGALTAAARDVRAVGNPALVVEGPGALRPFLAATLAKDRTALAVTATDREAEDLGAAVADLLGHDTVAVLPSWETLPHERLSPRPDTVGRRLAIFRSLADAATAPRLVADPQRHGIQSPQNSTRTGCSAVGGKTSTMPPRTANSPRAVTISTRV